MKHETRNTVEKLSWCNTCRKNTRHTVSDRRPVLCLEHNAGGETGLSRAQEKRREKQEREAREPRLL